MDLEGKHFIAGQPSQQEPPSFQASDPATGEDLAPAYANATTAEIDAAAEAITRAVLTLG